MLTRLAPALASVLVLSVNAAPVVFSSGLDLPSKIIAIGRGSRLVAALTPVVRAALFFPAFPQDCLRPMVIPMVRMAYPSTVERFMWPMEKATRM